MTFLRLFVLFWVFVLTPSKTITFIAHTLIRMYKINANNTDTVGSEKAPVILSVRENTGLVCMCSQAFPYQHAHATIIRSYHICDLLSSHGISSRRLHEMSAGRSYFTRLFLFVNALSHPLQSLLGKNGC